MLQVTAKSFFEKYGNHYKRIFKLNEYEYLIVSTTKISSNAIFYCTLNEQNKILAFCSFTETDLNLFELGDVAKVSYRFSRLQFASFLENASNFFHTSGHAIVGFPNSKALKLELDSGYSIISYYFKQPGLVFFNLLFMLPIEFTTSGYLLNLRLMSLRFINEPLKFSRRRYIISSNKNLSTRRAYFGVYLQYVESVRVSDFPYISYKGKITRMLNFHESDNSI